jgi:hypothetical protein
MGNPFDQELMPCNQCIFHAGHVSFARDGLPVHAGKVGQCRPRGGTARNV